MVERWHNFHMFRKNDNLNMQSRFVFVDTEAQRQKTGRLEIQTLLLGCAITWDRERKQESRLVFKASSRFWDLIEGQFQSCNKLICFAHNMGYDFRILDGANELSARGWKNVKFYVKANVFILEYEKDGRKLCLWSTTNYSAGELSELGKTVGLEKLGTFEEHEGQPESEMIEYCMRDTEIIFKYIQQLTAFLEQHQLTKLMPTAASISFNAYRHKFYSPKKKPIYVHDWKRAIALERESYLGGISDCLFIGEIPGTVHKLDINSMYPSIMLDSPVPTKLVFYNDQKDKGAERRAIYERFKGNPRYGMIARCRVRLPESHAYILARMPLGSVEKAVFGHGEFEVTRCSPELKFLEDYGEIIEISALAVYEMDVIFREFVSFFYDQRLTYKAQGDKINELFCKLALNSLYGKWAQKKTNNIYLSPDSPEYRDYHQCQIGEEGGQMIDTTQGQIRKYDFVELGSQLFATEETDDNSKDSFVAISSFITSYARMKLVSYILQAGRDNVFYMDTDSLFVNLEGLDRLKGHIDPNKLGYLKLEGSSEHVSIKNPKDYIFGDKKTLKGVRKKAALVRSEKGQDVYLDQRWEGFNTATKKGHTNHVRIELVEKKIRHSYEKGWIDEKGKVHPFQFKMENNISTIVDINRKKGKHGAKG